MDPGSTISRPYTKHKWVDRMICGQAIVSAGAEDLLRLPESMTRIKNRTDNPRFSSVRHQHRSRLIVYPISASYG